MVSDYDVFDGIFFTVRYHLSLQFLRPLHAMHISRYLPHCLLLIPSPLPCISLPISSVLCMLSSMAVRNKFDHGLDQCDENIVVHNHCYIPRTSEVLKDQKKINGVIYRDYSVLHLRRPVQRMPDVPCVTYYSTFCARISHL